MLGKAIRKAVLSILLASLMVGELVVGLIWERRIYR